MTKVNPRLWEQNNQHRRFWGEALRQGPEDGFAEEPPPPYAPLSRIIERWFRDATAGQPHRPRQAKIPSKQEIARIARLIWTLGKEARPAHDAPRAVALEKAHALQRSVARMQSDLRVVLDLVLPEAMLSDPAVSRLVDLWNAAQMAAPYIGPPSKQGPQKEAWHVVVAHLAPLVSAALISAGYNRPSMKSDGPAIKVICRALHHLEGIEREPDAVASHLKRRQKGATKN